MGGEPIKWTPEHDATIRIMREAGQDWDAVGLALDLHPEACRGRAKRLNMPIFVATFGRRMRVNAKNIAMRATPTVATYRGPLPPGSAETWHAITHGTCLEGIAYQYIPPVVLGRLSP